MGRYGDMWREICIALGIPSHAILDVSSSPRAWNEFNHIMHYARVLVTYDLSGLIAHSHIGAYGRFSYVAFLLQYSHAIGKALSNCGAEFFPIGVSLVRCFISKGSSDLDKFSVAVFWPNTEQWR